MIGKDPPRLPGSLCCCVSAGIRVEVGRKRGSNDQNDLPKICFGPLPQVWVLGLVVVNDPGDDACFGFGSGRTAPVMMPCFGCGSGK